MVVRLNAEVRTAKRPIDLLTEVCWNFMYNIYPRATEQELREISNIDDGLFSKTTKEDKEKRHKLMQEIIDKRNSKGYNYRNERYHNKHYSEYFDKVIGHAAAMKKKPDEYPSYGEWITEKQKQCSYEKWVSEQDWSLSEYDIERER